MPTRNQIKYVKTLRKKKTRAEDGVFVAEGRKLVLEGLKEGWKADLLFCLPHLKESSDWADAEICDQNSMERMTQLSSASEALAVFKIPGERKIPSFKGSRWIVLDGIKDPGNFGTIVRIADWFKWDGVVCSEDCVDVFNSKTVQSSMGSLFRVPVQYGNLSEVLGDDRLVIGTAMQGQNIWDFSTESERSMAVVIGSEAHGISKEVESLCKQKLSIPGGGSESLNAGISAGIIVAALSRFDPK